MVGVVREPTHIPIPGSCIFCFFVGEEDQGEHGEEEDDDDSLVIDDDGVSGIEIGCTGSDDAIT